MSDGTIEFNFETDYMIETPFSMASGQFQNYLQPSGSETVVNGVVINGRRSNFTKAVLDPVLEDEETPDAVLDNSKSDKWFSPKEMVDFSKLNGNKETLKANYLTSMQDNKVHTFTNPVLISMADPNAI